MKAIHYDAEGDILSVSFSEADGQSQTGVELSDNIVLYYNPETEMPLKLILLSYQAMVQASARGPIVLDGLVQTPAHVKTTVMGLLQRMPLTAFLQLDTRDSDAPTSRLHEVFTPAALQTVAT